MRPELDDLLVAATPFSLPLRRPFRGIIRREGMIIVGPSGAGEFAPFDDYSDEAAARWLACAIEAAFGTWPAPCRDSIKVNAILPSLSPNEAGEWAAHARDDLGVSTIKVKVGEDGDDLPRLQAVRREFAGRIRIDVNARWTLAEAEAALPRLADAAGGLEYVEQPVAELDDLARLRQRVEVPIAVDEAVRKARDPLAIAERIRDAADVVVLKPAPLGGVARSLEIAAGLSMPVVVSGSLDSSVGLAPAVALAAALPVLSHDCGLGTGALFATDLTESMWLPVDGRIEVGRRGPDPDRLAVARLVGADAERWRTRLTRAYERLAG